MTVRNAFDFGNKLAPVIAIKCTIDVRILQPLKQKKSAIPLLPNFET